MKTQTRMIVASVVVIALALTAVSGITYSWFSDTEKAEITVSTAKIDYSVAYTSGTTSSIGTTVSDGSGGTFAIEKLAPRANIWINANITNNSNIKTVYKIVAKPTISEGSSFTYYDLINVNFNGTALKVSDLDNEVIIKDWTVAEAGAAVGEQNITITVPDAYGGTTEAPIKSFDSITGEGSTNEATTGFTAWDKSTEKSGLSIKISITAVQGDYPYTVMTVDPSTKVASSALPANKVVKADEIESATGATAKVTDVIVDFSNISTYSSGASTASDITGNKVTVGVNSVDTTDNKVNLNLKLLSSTDTEISSPTFDEPVVMTMTVPGKFTNPEVIYNGSGENGTIISSVINDDNTTTITFSVTHFSEYVIQNVADVSDATTLKSKLEAGNSVRLLNDINMGNTFITIDKPNLSLDLNGYKITGEYTKGVAILEVKESLNICNGTIGDGVADRGINLNEITKNDEVTLSLTNVNIAGNERGISIYGNTCKVTVNITGGSVSAKYALNLGGGNNEVSINGKNSTVSTGYCAVQTFIPNSKLTFDNCKLIGDNIYSGSSDNFGIIVLNKEASGSTVNLNNCEIIAYERGTAKEYLLDIRCPSVIVADSCSYYYNGTPLDGTIASLSSHIYKERVQITPSVDGSKLTITASSEA